jgi:hypothetical protein
MTQQTLAQRTSAGTGHIEPVDTSALSLPSLATLPDTALKDALADVLDRTRARQYGGGFDNGSKPPSRE